jgi:hypothetical protein
MQKPVKPRSIKLPKGLDKLPRVVVTATPSSTSDQSEQENVVWGVTSLDEALETALKRFGGGFKTSSK